MVTQKQPCVIFDTRRLAHATPLVSVLHTYKNQILLGEQHRGACQLLPTLHHTASQREQVVQKKNAHISDWSPLLNSFPDARCHARSSVDRSSKFPSVIVDDRGGKEMVAKRWRGIPGRSQRLDSLVPYSSFKAESTEISNLAEGIFSTYHCEFIGNDSTAGLKDCIHRGSYTRHQLYYTG